MKLYTYYRSQASFRVRIALNLKGIAREDSLLHLEKGDQFAAAYRAINPQTVVPTLIEGDVKLFQSLTMFEYLEETHPEPPLLPTDPVARAWVRGLAWIQHWLGAGLQAMETLLAGHPESGRFCHGDGPSIADICLVTQVTPGKTFDLPLDPYPRVMCIYDTAWPSRRLPMRTRQNSPTRNERGAPARRFGHRHSGRDRAEPCPRNIRVIRAFRMLTRRGF
jgi:glutathione S-transferase